MSYTTENIRNVALAGHPGAGKTMLFEALLHAGGAIQTAGSIERGTTVSDYDPIEKERGHSIDAAIASIDTASDNAPVHVNLLDTPGYPDFRGPTLSTLAAVETVAIVCDAGAGVEYGTRRMMEYAKARNLCRVIIVNKIDHAEADSARLLDALREAFGPEVLPLNLPADGGTRVVDCFGYSGKLGEGDSDLGPVADWHQKILDQVVEVNETVMDHYLDLGEDGLSGQELHDAFEQCLREGHLVPVCFVSARSGVGMADLLQVTGKLLPHPGEGNPPNFVKGTGRRRHADRCAARSVEARHRRRLQDRQRSFRRQARHLPRLPGHGEEGHAAVHRRRQEAVQGRPPVQDQGQGPRRSCAGGSGRHRGRGQDRRPAFRCGAARFARRGPDPPGARVDFPKPMFGLAVEAAHKGQEQKLSTALHKLSEEDPAFAVEQHGELNETVVRGLSDLHLRVMIQRLNDKYGVEVKTRPPRIAYRETVSGNAEGHYRHKKQTGGAGQFGEVFLRIEPLPRGSGFEFVDEVKGGTIPGQFMPAVEKGVRQVLGAGAVAGYPLQDVRVVVYDGKHHSVDSKEVAFVAAGKKAFLDAIAKARPQVLEPIVDLEVAAPEQHMGDISGGLSSKRARISGTDSLRGGEIVIRAQVPLSELEGYAAELKSVTAGRGRYALDFSHYEPVPPQVQSRLVEAFKPRIEED